MIDMTLTTTETVVLSTTEQDTDGTTAHRTVLERFRYAMNRSMGLCQRDQDYATALPFLRAAAILNPDEAADPLWWIAVCYEALERDEEALSSYLECIRLHPEVPGGYKAVARLLLKQGRVEEAELFQERFRALQTEMELGE